MKRRALARLREEEGAELIEFIGMLPLLFLVGLIIWQLVIAGHTILITASAAREGARAAATCPRGDATSAIVRASPGYNGRRNFNVSVGGDTVVATVRLRIPILDIPGMRPIWTNSRAVMRRERGPGCP